MVEKNHTEEATGCKVTHTYCVSLQLQKKSAALMFVPSHPCYLATKTKTLKV